LSRRKSGSPGGLPLPRLVAFMYLSYYRKLFCQFSI
jgi:hypothetical protein